mgnify:CR=1 FL=1
MLRNGIPQGVNHLRLGESLLFGKERAKYQYLPGPSRMSPRSAIRITLCLRPWWCAASATARMTSHSEWRAASAYRAVSCKPEKRGQKPDLQGIHCRPAGQDRLLELSVMQPGIS